MDRPPWTFAQAILPDIVEQATNSATWNLVFSWPHLLSETVPSTRGTTQTRQQESSLSDEEEEEEEIKEEDEVA